MKFSFPTLCKDKECLFIISSIMCCCIHFIVCTMGRRFLVWKFWRSFCSFFISKRKISFSPLRAHSAHWQQNTFFIFLLVYISSCSARLFLSFIQSPFVFENALYPVLALFFLFTWRSLHYYTWNLKTNVQLLTILNIY